MSERSAYDFGFNALADGALDLGGWRGRPLLIVNTASRCGFTPQYKGLQSVWRKYRDDGLMVIGVPSNDFGGQEPGEPMEIMDFCEKNFGVDFPLTEKSHVKGADAHPLFQWLAMEGGFFSRPRWNFYKYLIGRDGRLKDWYSSLTAPDAPKFDTAIRNLLSR